MAKELNQQLEVNAPQRAVVKLYNENTTYTPEINEVKEPRFRYFMTIPYWTGLCHRPRTSGRGGFDPFETRPDGAGWVLRPKPDPALSCGLDFQI